MEPSIRPETEGRGPSPVRAAGSSRRLEKHPMPRHDFRGTSTVPDERNPKPRTIVSPASSFGLGIQTSGSSSIASRPSAEQSKEKPRRNVLRRKASSVNQHSEYARSETTTSSSDLAPPASTIGSASVPGGYQDPYPGSILGITLPSGFASTSYIPSMHPSISAGATSSSVRDNKDNAKSLHQISTQDLPVATSLRSGYTSSPSTRCSESPGPFSRTSTPTSMSSHSPALLLGSKAGPRTRQLSPTRSRPPVTLAGRRAGALIHGEGDGKLDSQGLPALRESLTSSSSGSTVKAGERGGKSTTQIRKKTARLSPPPPSPPLRKSSRKFSKTTPSPKTPGNNIGIKSGSSGQNVQDSAAREAPLVEAAVALSSSSHGVPPIRPSRLGTPNLDDQYQPSPVIQSNLSRLETTGHKRRESLEVPKSSLSGQKASVSNVTPVSSTSHQKFPPKSRIPSRQPSPNPVSSSVESPSSSWKLVHGRLPQSQATIPSPAFSRGVSPTSAGSGRSTSKLGLFSRRTKATGSDEAEKEIKKGPTAGTGHEGYGKYARRGRSGSASTSGSQARSASASSTSGSATRTASSRKSSITSRGEQEMDEFFLERLAPVVIGGGGAIVENHNNGAEITRTGSGQDLRRPSLESRSSTKSKMSQGLRRGMGNSSASDVSSLGPTNYLRSTKLASRMDGEPEGLGASDRPRVSALAVRRSLHRSQVFNEEEPMKTLTPIKTNVLALSPSPNSHDTSQSSIPQTDSTLPFMQDFSEGKEGNWLKPKIEKPEKSSRRWNFFQRAQRSPQQTAHPIMESQSRDVVELPVTITKRSDARPIAHYAMFDAAEDLDSDTFDDSLHEVEDYPALDTNRVEDTSSSYVAQIGVEEHVWSPILPSRPVFPVDVTQAQRPCSPKVMLRSAETPTTPQNVVEHPQIPRPSRLPQVGRIPMVVSKRDRNHQPPVQSFSRPFAQQPRPSHHPSFNVDIPDGSARADRPVLGIHTDLIPNRQWEGFEFNDPASAPAADLVASESAKALIDSTEFLAFPPRKASEMSGSSSSGTVTFANTTAVLPTPDAAPSDDEVWNEYDDLIDNVLSTNVPKTPLSTTSSLGAPFQYANLATKALQPQVNQEKESPAVDSAISPSVPGSVLVPLAAPTAGAEVSSPGHSSRLVSPLRSSALPSTPISFTEFFAGYGERNIGKLNTDTERSSSSRSRHSSASARSKQASLPPPSSGDKSYYRNTQLMNFAEKERDGPEAQTNLRFGALMTSRWLSFGRVLFSPAHAEIKNNRQDRLLILDGLGNDDWSFYCALTYPDATVYNLSPYQPTGQMSARKRESGAWQSPSNHRQIHHTSIAHPFPFPKGFFTAVILRFPVANSEAAYRNAISECKRVLRPGGFLEISALDLDMMNMGNRARRAVRMLKVRMQVADSDVSLKPVSDNIQKMLGRRGFENLNRCTVGVPVAGKIPESRSGSLDEKNLSLSDMLKDQSEEGDEGITKMVAKVGRWWYTRCYELGVLPDGDLERSIWNDKALLSECEKRETNFKLLICYAQKPLAPRRRTVSV
ncbi:MAG: hypothetical protein M1830_001009 [Pleopsidium flavum]|nr:MAG: hypothetical protein M1830_001009 [Pleopsidium flavum]